MRRATAPLLALLLLAGCRSILPWSKEPIGQEVNLAFTLVNNQVRLGSVGINGASGEFILGTAQPRTILDVGMASRSRATPERAEVKLGATRSIVVVPLVADIGNVADGILGADAFAKRAVTIDYRSGLVTYQREGIHPEMMTLYRFAGAPAVDAIIDGTTQRAIVDTANPDTLLLPGTGSRGRAHVTIGGIDFGDVDVGYANIDQPRLGNRLLAHFLVTIDYGKGVVGLYRDPRVPMQPVSDHAAGDSKGHPARTAGH